MIFIAALVVVAECLIVGIATTKALALSLSSNSPIIRTPQQQKQQQRPPLTPPMIQYRVGQERDILPLAWNLRIPNPLEIVPTEFIVAVVDNDEALHQKKSPWERLLSKLTQQQQSEVVVGCARIRSTTISPTTTTTHTGGGGNNYVKNDDNPTLTTTTTTQRYSELDSIWVDPMYRRRGIGTQLVVRTILQQYRNQRRMQTEHNNNSSHDDNVAYMLVPKPLARWFYEINQRIQHAVSLSSTGTSSKDDNNDDDSTTASSSTMKQSDNNSDINRLHPSTVGNKLPQPTSSMRDNNDYTVPHDDDEVRVQWVDRKDIPEPFLSRAVTSTLLANMGGGLLGQPELVCMKVVVVA